MRSPRIIHRIVSVSGQAPLSVPTKGKSNSILKEYSLIRL